MQTHMDVHVGYRPRLAAVKMSDPQWGTALPTPPGQRARAVRPADSGGPADRALDSENPCPAKLSGRATIRSPHGLSG